MAHITTYLQNESGIQNNGVNVIDDNTPKAPINNVFIGKFKRGRLDTPMKVTKANVRAVLGHEPWNPDYVAVHDALDNGIGEISVLRIYTEPFFPEDPEPQPEPGEPEPQPQPEDPNVTQILAFDFAVISYIWDENGGRDMDTRTLITKPLREVIVGWNKERSDGSYLIWGGDNVSTGREDILLNLIQLQADYPTDNNFEIELRAFWFSQVLSGNFKLRFATYKGGQMVQNGVNFDNVGGQIIQDILIDHNTMAYRMTNGNEGVTVGKITYDAINKSGQLIKI
ncbi:TPA: hypothetical protein NM870_003747 [Acinetobacter baumannii]|nr:hypothetical protein [Acinetobacter baumannii]